MTERKKPNNKRLILMIVLLAVVIALMWLLPDGSQPAAPATNAPKTEQTKMRPTTSRLRPLLKPGHRHPISGWKCSTARPSPWAVCAAKWCF